jgi:hypothetical protein
MPNHVYSTLTIIDEKYAPLIEAAIVINGGLAQLLKPMPSELRDTQSPPRIMTDEEMKEWESGEHPLKEMTGRPITKAESDRMLKQYGANNWYDWAVDNWGTKWGTYDHHWDRDTMTLDFCTAWGPMSEDMLERLAQLIPDFDLMMIEESGDFDYKIASRNGKIKYS